MQEFRVNYYISLKLIDDKTIIFVGNKEFKQCKYLLLEIPIRQFTSISEIESIDAAAEKLDRSLRHQQFQDNVETIPSKVEFWGHCSNLQVWSENEYSTNLLHRSIAFPLLRRLAEVGDPLARRIFKSEIAQRFSMGHFTVNRYLITEDYLKYLNGEEIKTLIHDLFLKKDIPSLVMLFRSGYFDVFDRTELNSIIKEHDELLKVKDGELKLLASELFQQVAIKEIKKQFYEEDELLIGHDKITLYDYDLGLVRSITSLEIINTYHDDRSLDDIFGLELLIDLKRLRLINLKVNNVSKLARLQDLKELKLNGCSISTLVGMGSLNQLEFLDLSDNNIRSFESISNLTQLRTLDLSHNSLSNIGDLKNHPNLHCLDLGYNKISRLDGIECLSKLQELYLCGNSIIEISKLTNLRNLERLVLSDNKIISIDGLERLNKLSYLDIRRNQIIDVHSLERLSHVRNFLK